MKDPARYKTLVPEEDRKLFDPDAWLSAAVALDVLSTRLGAIDPKTLSIDDVVRAAVEVGMLGGLDASEVDTLLDKPAARLVTRAPRSPRCLPSDATSSEP